MPQISIQRKKLLGSKSQNCLVIPLGGGVKVQYPVVNESDALAIYSYYSNLHPHLRQMTLQS